MTSTTISAIRVRSSAALPRAVAEAVAGQRYHHHIEGVGAGGKQRHDGQHLHERARPAVQHYQRQANTVGCFGVHGVHAESVDVDLEMRVLVEPGLLGWPVELLQPGVHERAQH
jgi:hypothetical protein